MTREEIMTLVKGLPTEPTSRTTIELTNHITSVTDSFNVTTMSVKKKLLNMTGWTEKKLEKVSIKIG